MSLFPSLIKNITPDQEIEKIVSTYMEKVKVIMDKVVGETKIELTSETEDRTADTNLGNLITDSMREKAGSDIALYNRGGIRAPIAKGVIKWADVFNVLPFDDYIVSMDLTGEQVQRLLEQAATLNKAMLQLSGVHLKYSLSAEPGKRVKEVWVGGKLLDPQKVYRVTTTEFLAGGGDDFSVFKEGKNLQTDVFARDAFAEYLMKHSPITSVEMGRIVAEP
jgi:2',3'-cyclic-nucleotide 2'-phosphodiesterase (5'-nucleotidase family)